MTPQERDETMQELKKALEAGKSVGFVTWFESRTAGLAPELRREWSETRNELIAGERARLIKMKSLGLTDRVEEMLALLLAMRTVEATDA